MIRKIYEKVMAMLDESSAMVQTESEARLKGDLNTDVNEDASLFTGTQGYKENIRF